MKKEISINELTNPLVELLIKEKDRLGIEVLKGPEDCTIIDAGINVNACVEAGLIISRICLGGLGVVNIDVNDENIFRKSSRILILNPSRFFSFNVIFCTVWKNEVLVS